MKRNIRQIKRELANFQRRAVGNFAKFRNDEYADGKTFEQILVEKCAIVNRELFGGNEDDYGFWEKPETLITTLMQMMLYEAAEHGEDSPSVAALNHVADVLAFLNLPNQNKEPHSLAVAEPLRSVPNLHKLVAKATAASKHHSYDYVEAVNNWLEKIARDIFRKADRNGDKKFIRKVLDEDSSIALKDSIYWNQIDKKIDTYCKDHDIDPLECLSSNIGSPDLCELKETWEGKELLDPYLLDADMRRRYAEGAWDCVIYDKVRDEYYDEWVKEYGKPSTKKLSIRNIFNAFINGDIKKVKSILSKARDISPLLGKLIYVIFVRELSFGETIDYNISTETLLDLMKLLVEQGADINAECCEDGAFTPLTYATRLAGHYGRDEDDIDVINFMLGLGADPNATSRDGYTPLMEAAVGYELEFVKLLIDAGADVNAKTDDGASPLFFAVWGTDDKLAIVKALVEASADVNATNNDGGTPLDNASNDCVKIKRYLKLHGAVPGKSVKK